MRLGLIVTYSPRSRSGLIADAEGSSWRFKYAQGQSLAIGKHDSIPMLTGRHTQAIGFALKEPRVGDAIIFEAVANAVCGWGYLRHWLELVEQRYGTDFLVDPRFLRG
jgi:hypothetical protein